MHFAVVIDGITQAVRDIPDRAPSFETAKRKVLLTQIWDASNANYPSNWEKLVLRKAAYNAFLIARKHSVDPAYGGSMGTSGFERTTLSVVFNTIVMKW